jgi:sialic acid synthase SpsE
MIRETKFQTIGEAFEFMRMDGSASLALIDCMNAYALGTDHLEKHFDSHLWLADEDGDANFDSDEAKQYYIELARIEEFLVHQELIYSE